MIQKSRIDKITLVKMDHGKVNALDLELLLALDRELQAEEQSDSEALVLTGNAKAFSAGVDLFRIVNGKSEYVLPFLKALDQVVKRLFLFPKPTVAAVNSHAIAGGAVLALCCDLRLMSEGNGKFGLTELKVGVPFPSFILELVRATVAPGYFQELIYRSELYDVKQSLDRGFIHELVPALDLEKQAVDRARQLASIPSETFLQTKKQVVQPMLDFIEKHGHKLDRKVEKIWTDPMTYSKIQSFLDATVGKK